MLCSLPVCAQTLHPIEVQPAPNGRNGALSIELLQAEGKEPVALQWEFSFPESVQLDFKGASTEEAAAKAQKAIRCELLASRQGKTQTVRCILAGGTAAIPGGPIANLKFGGARPFRPGRYEVQIKKAIAVMPDLKKVALKDARVEITISK